MDPMHALPSEDGGVPVVLRIYDLSRGMAASFSQALIGKKIDGIWHTGVYVFGKEYYFGGGIQSDPINYVEARVGKPLKTLLLGYTYIPKEMFHEYLHEISPQFTPQTYNLFTHNCNNFSSEVARFLTGNDIPEYILNLPQEALNTPIGAMIKNMMEGFQSSMQHSGFLPGFDSPTQSPITTHTTRTTTQPIIESPSQPPKPSTTSQVQQASQPLPTSTSSQPPMSPKSAWTEESLSKQPLETRPQHADSRQRRQETLRNQKIAPLLSDQGNLTPIASKIATISSTLAEHQRVSPDEQETLMAFAQGKVPASATYPIIDRIIKTWPAAHLMSVFFFTKMIVLDETCAESYMSENDGLIEKTLDLLLPNTTTSQPVQIMALCVMTNAISKKPTFSLIKLHNRSSILVDIALRGIYSTDLNIRMTCSALLQNLILALLENDESELLTQIVCSLVDRICVESDKVICLRIFEQLCYIAGQNLPLFQLIDELEPSLPESILKSDSASTKLLLTALLQNQ
eukprot:TRINITY_DN4258_c0_g1_i10.p2 TRINITY_DN4258_c0_g1~~TRINITY_DN4258_c0_g1_i10.p2  ORF type:complete len:515 (-),score=99.45 TRINITY_DN4258_c0_g1_i10:3028-4572(-)